MELFIYLIIILFILVIYTVVSTIIKTSLFLTTRYKYENYRLFLPTIFTFFAWIIIGISLNLVVKQKINMSLPALIFNHIIKIENISNYSVSLIVIFILHITICVILQSFTYFLTNVNLKKALNYIRYNLKKIFVKNLRDIDTKDTNNNESTMEAPLGNITDENSKNMENLSSDDSNNNTNLKISIVEPFEDLNFVNSLIASLLSTALIMVFIVGLFLVGVSIAGKILYH